MEIDIPVKPKTPWTHYMNNKETVSHTITSKDINKKILDLSWTRYDIACAIAVLYLTASRLHEILPYEYNGVYKNEAKELGYIIKKPGFLLRNLTLYKDENGDLLWHFKTLNLKQNSKKSADKIDIHKRLKLLQKNNYKEIHIPLAREFPDFPLTQLLDEFFDAHNFYRDDLNDAINSLPNNSYLRIFKESFEDINPFAAPTYKVLSTFAKKIFKTSLHGFREMRMQILRREYYFDVSDLSVVGGWSKTSNMALRYSRSSQKELIHKFRAKALEELQKREK